MLKPTTRLDARAISHIARNPDCQRRIRVYQVGETPDGLAGKLRGEIPITMSPFQRQVGLQFEKSLLEYSAVKLLNEFHRNGLLPAPDELDSNGIINLEDNYGLVANAKDPDAQLEFLAEKTSYHLRQRMLDPSSPYLLLKAVLKMKFAGFKAYIRPDFLIALPGQSFYFPGEIKSLLMLREDTKSADLDKMKRQAAVESLALQRLYEEIIAKDQPDYSCITDSPKKSAMIIVREKRMLPRLYQCHLNAEQDFLIDAEKVLLEQLTEAEFTNEQSVDLAFLEAIQPTLCDTCESECALAGVCRQSATLENQISSLGEDLVKAMPQMDTIEQAFLLLGVSEPPTESESLIRERLLNELDAAESSGGLMTLNELKRESRNA